MYRTASPEGPSSIIVLVLANTATELTDAEKLTSYLLQDPFAYQVYNHSVDSNFFGP